MDVLKFCFGDRWSMVECNFNSICDGFIVCTSDEEYGCVNQFDVLQFWHWAVHESHAFERDQNYVLYVHYEEKLYLLVHGSMDNHFVQDTRYVSVLYGNLVYVLLEVASIMKLVLGLVILSFILE